MLTSVVQSKLVSMLALGIGSFIVGVAPVCFVSRVQDLQQKLLLSCTLCFGGGVLFATAVLHMLPETRETLPEHAELVFACGFLLLYLIDESVHYVWGSNDAHAPDTHLHGPGNLTNQGGRCRSHSHQTNLPGSMGIRKTTTYGAMQYAPSAPAACSIEEATFLCHGSHTEPCADSNTGLVGLLLALTVHSVLEGLAIGLQKATSEVIFLAAAVASHKFVVGFCLGLELAGAGSTLIKIILAIFVFSGGSAVGIGFGMLALRAKQRWSTVALPILQGLAGGTLLYVTVSEVLPRERARWHRSARRSAGIVQFFFVFLGFVVVFLLNRYVGA